MIAGYFALADKSRPQAAAAVNELQRCGLVTAMLTGDGPGAAAAVAAATGLQQQHVHASLLPQDKFDVVSGSGAWYGRCASSSKSRTQCLDVVCFWWMRLLPSLWRLLNCVSRPW